MRASRKVVLASTNLDKLAEFRALVAGRPIEVIAASAVIANADKLAHVETHDTYAENAAAKARFANHASHYPCLADDSGLEVDALQGKPGARSARFAIPKAGQSQDQANIEKLLEALKGVPSSNRGARFVCHLALSMEGILITSSGVLEGSILEAPRGASGFGYDPIFIPKGSKKSFAELTSGEKNLISHRALAMQELFTQMELRDIAWARP